MTTPAAPPAPPTALFRDPTWRRAIVGVSLAALVGLWLVAWEVVAVWTKADYSHGFLVPAVCGYLLWLRRDRFPTRTVGMVTAEPTGTAGVAVARSVKVRGPVSWPNPWGLAFFAAAGALALFGLKTNLAKETSCGLALGLVFVGIAWMFCGGRAGVAWAWPALAFWAFAVQLPFQIEQKVSLALRGIATDASSAAFQLLGFPSYVGSGNDLGLRYIITLDGTPLNVAAACAGLSMFLTFLALTAGICLLCPPSRPVSHRLFLFASAVPIAVGCNILRIVVSGLILHAGWRDFYNLIAHDMAGWLMMPLALGVLWLELRLMDWIWVPVEYATTDEVAKALLDRAREKVAKDDARRADAASKRGDPPAHLWMPTPPRPPEPPPVEMQPAPPVAPEAPQ